jgi:pimeloyl-ACP methyl ester carboxylesterase
VTRRVVSALAAALLASMACAQSAGRSAEVLAGGVYLAPQRLVSIGDRKLNLYCAGEGSPTVVFDSGLGDGVTVWGLVQPMVATATRACAYDRAGLGFSDPASTPRTSANMVDDLHRVLRAGGVDPPYVLVGHSLGGLTIKLYAFAYPTEVAGLVFVDPSHEDLAKRAWEIDPRNAKKYAALLETLHACQRAKPADFTPGSRIAAECTTISNEARFGDAINALERERLMRPGFMNAWISEQENVWAASAAQVRGARRDLGGIPLVVLTHEPLPRQPDETPEMRDAQNALRTELHTQISTLSTRGSIRTVRNSGHYFQLDQPGEVIAAVLEVVRAAR